MTNNGNISIYDKSKDKTTVSARVNSFVVDKYKESDIPISLIIETSLIHFLKLTDEEKIIFINRNIPETTKVGDFKIPKLKWDQLLRKYINRLTLPTSVLNGLFTGMAIGAISIIASVLTAIDFDEENEENE